jgi:myo-inositol-1(or 4)-monophosphatase
MITESGGMVTGAGGEPDALNTGSVLASNLDLHPVVLERLRAAA